MSQNNRTIWWGKKSKATYGILKVETAVDRSVTIVCRKVSSHVRICHFFKKVFHEQRSFTNYKKAMAILLPLLFLLSGCLATPIKPSDNKMDEIHTILVVPVESPPLEVIPDLIETRFPVYNQYQYQSMPYYAFSWKKRSTKIPAEYSSLDW